ncbi:MAG TPA: methyltransferase domain-containing protein [Pyrinomonadaceae bacterium]|jgi:SAM-dependent methyltransferase|nr:methyltransferase domain-containing protein [Pyrinomonadaceae bacterium]
MPGDSERDYVIGTHDEEIARLGIQHHVWRPRVLQCWRKAGITTGSRVMDVGAGPGYATIDLAEIVGADGEVIAVERSAHFLQNARQACRMRGLSNIRFCELDLMDEPLGATGLDAIWCRWVACFVLSPAKLVAAMAASLRAGGVAVFHEYIDYGSWRLAPRRPAVESFVGEVMASWRASGGEPDIAISLPGLLREAGFRILHIAPVVYAVTPVDFAWQWPSRFLKGFLPRLLELGRVDAAWVDSVRREFQEAESDPSTIMVTPMLLEIIAEHA